MSTSPKRRGKVEKHNKFSDKRQYVYVKTIKFFYGRVLE